MIKSELESIPGLGEKTISVLLKEFKSINGLRKADTASLAQFVGAKKAGIIKDFLAQDLS